MKKIATTKEMQALDATAIQKAGIPGLILMENASLGVIQKIQEISGEDLSDSHFIIVCGKGNNGGDGFAIARHLLNRNAHVTVLSAGPIRDLKGDAKTNADILIAIGGKIRELRETDSLPRLAETDMIIDALLGTGISGAARGFTARLIEWINDRPEPVLAVDIPSGVEGDTGAAKGPAIIANWTVTMGLFKRGLVLPPGRDLAGEVTVAIISLPPAVRAGKHIPFNLLETSDIHNMLPIRNPAFHKGDCGRAFVLAGSPGMTGAAALCAQAALRVGSGLVILGVPESLNPIMEMKLTEVMTRRLAENSDGCVCKEALPTIEELISWADVIAVGPGLSQHTDTEETVRLMLSNLSKPVVIDADGLNVLGDENEFAGMLPSGSIMTPHPGEFSRLTGIPIEDILENRVELAAEKAETWGAVVVLKGSPTIIADPAGEVFCNSTGGPSLATGGTGDVLTGMIVGLLAQGCPPIHAACAGAFLHGLAGDLSAKEVGVAATVANDLDIYIPRAIRAVNSEA